MVYLRLTCVALALTLPFGALHLANARSRPEAQPTVYPVMPQQLGEWAADRDTELDARIEDMLAPEAYTMRLYAARGRPPIWIYAAFYPGIGTVGAHDPLICYPAQGWTIAERRSVDVEIGPGQTFPAWFMRTELGGAEELVLYWFQPVERWPSSAVREYAMRALDRLKGQPQYAFLRLSLRSPRTRRAGSATEIDALTELATAVAPWARLAVRPESRP